MNSDNKNPNAKELAELKPCPFCGKRMQFRKALWPSDGCVDAVIHAEPTDCGLVDFSTNTIDESVIKHWNQRTHEDALLAEHERDMLQVIDERDKAEDTITDCAALFGDQYEWVARIPAELPPNSGDLHDDLPCLIKDMLAENERLREALTLANKQIAAFVDNPNNCIHPVFYFRNVNSYIEEALAASGEVG